MNKYIISFVALFNLAQLYCEIPILPATDAQVRRFRAQFASEIQETKRKNNLQYDAIAIFVFINELMEEHRDPERIFEQKLKIVRHLDKRLHPLQIAEGVRLGYGFDRGVCSDLVVSPTEQSQYKAALESIGRFIVPDSERASVRHVFSQSAASPAIAEHISISNGLMYKASPGAPEIFKFMYAPSEYAANRALENSIDLSPEQVSEFRDKGRAYVKSLAPPEYNLDGLNENMFSFFGLLTDEDLEKIRGIFIKNTSSVTFREKLEASLPEFLGLDSIHSLTREHLEKFPRQKAFSTALESLGYLFESPFAWIEHFRVTFSTYLTFAACADISEIPQDPEQESLKAKFFTRFRTFSHLHPYFVKQSLSMSDDQFNRCIECAKDYSEAIFHSPYLEVLEYLLALPEDKREYFLNRKTLYKDLSYSILKLSLSVSDDQFNLLIENATDDSGKISQRYLQALLDLTEEERAVFLNRKTQNKNLSFYDVLDSLSISDNEFNLCIESATDYLGKINERYLWALLDLTADERAVFLQRKTQCEDLSFYDVLDSLSISDDQFNRRSLNVLQTAQEGS